MACAVDPSVARGGQGSEAHYNGRPPPPPERGAKSRETLRDRGAGKAGKRAARPDEDRSDPPAGGRAGSAGYGFRASENPESGREYRAG